MTTPKALLILHGKQALNEDVRAAVLARREQGWELAVRVTWEGGDAERLVNEALDGGYTHIIAGGGDGTLRDVAEAMALAKTDASLVLMPLGTANDFAKAAGVPLEPAGALALLDVQPRAIDLGQVGGQIFPEHGHRRFRQPGHGQHFRRPEESPRRRRLPVHRFIALQ
ncbi:diacylglycerol kinase family enzyme [Pseudomonas synxantha]|nr:diacylglycerol kinase family enzyme [Pseudomonas synxantha]